MFRCEPQTRLPQEAAPVAQTKVVYRRSSAYGLLTVRRNTSRRSPVHTNPLLSLIMSASRVIAVPLALVTFALVRSGREQLEIDSTQESELQVQDGTIRTQAVVVNRTGQPIVIERVEITVSDALGTFTLRNETEPATVPAGYSLAVSLVASNFHALRMSRRCIFRARFFNQTGCLGNFSQSFINLWPSKYFEDDSRPIPYDFSDFAAHHSANATSGLDRRL